MSPTYLDGSKEKFLEFMALPTDGPLKMLNLLKFKDKVEETGKSGAETYAEYLTEAQPFFEKSSARILFMGEPQFTLIGPESKEWDKVLIVQYDSKPDFMNMVLAEGYPSHIRRSALEDSRLIFCK